MADELLDSAEAQEEKARRNRRRKQYIEALQNVLNTRDGRIVAEWLLRQCGCARTLPVDEGEIALFNMGQRFLWDTFEASPINAQVLLNTFYDAALRGKQA